MVKFLEIGNSLIVIEKQQAILQQNVLDSSIVLSLNRLRSCKFIQIDFKRSCLVFEYK